MKQSKRGARKSRAAELAQTTLDDYIGPFLKEKTLLLTARQTCRILGICQRTLYYWSSGPSPRLPSVRIAHSRRWVLGDVKRLIDNGKIAA